MPNLGFRDRTDTNLRGKANKKGIKWENIKGPYGAPFVYKRKGKDIMVYSLIAVAVFVSGAIAVPMFCMGIALIYTSLRNYVK